MSSHIQALDISSIVFSSHVDAVSDGENREYGTELLMKSGTKAVSGWRLFEQTECPQETAATSYQHTPCD